MTTAACPSLAARICAVLDERSAALVATYFDPASRFAGATFDTLPPNERDRFGASDILAASLLDVPFEPRAVRTLLADPDSAFARLLRDVPDDVDLWAATDTQLAAANDLYRAARALPGVGPTRTSKLLARKRLRLLPVMDGVVRAGLGLEPGDDSWQMLRAAYADHDGALVAGVQGAAPVRADRAGEHAAGAGRGAVDAPVEVGAREEGPRRSRCDCGLFGLRGRRPAAPAAVHRLGPVLHPRPDAVNATTTDRCGVVALRRSSSRTDSGCPTLEREPSRLSAGQSIRLRVVVVADRCAPICGHLGHACSGGECAPDAA